MADRDQVCGKSAAAAVTHFNAVKFVLFGSNNESRHVKIKLFRFFFPSVVIKTPFTTEDEHRDNHVDCNAVLNVFFLNFACFHLVFNSLTLPSVNYHVFFSPLAFSTRAELS